jgi:hypothetical protein
MRRNPKTRVIAVRFTEAEVSAIDAAYAVSADNTRSDLIRRVLLEGLAPRPNPPERGAVVVPIPIRLLRAES